MVIDLWYFTTRLKKHRQRPAPHKKICGFACTFLAEIRPKKSPHTPVWGDFFNRFHLKNSLAKLLRTEKEQILCGAEARRRRHAVAWQDGATKESVQNLPLRRMFSYAEPAKTVLFHSIKRCISCGIGAVKCNSCPVTGWVNHSSYECSAGRAMRVLSSVP